MQVLLVTGGVQYTGGEYITLDSTEVLEDMAGSWRLTGPLPSARDGLKAASVANTIFLFGEYFLFYIEQLSNDDIFSGGYDDVILKDILRYNKNHTWEEVGQMKEARDGHSVAVLEDVSQLCP